MHKFSFDFCFSFCAFCLLFFFLPTLASFSIDFSLQLSSRRRRRRRSRYCRRRRFRVANSTKFIGPRGYPLLAPPAVHLLPLGSPTRQLPSSMVKTFVCLKMNLFISLRCLLCALLLCFLLSSFVLNSSLSML